MTAGRIENQLKNARPGLADVIGKIPYQSRPPLPPEWLRVEMLERYQVVQHADITPGTTVLEIGAGPHAITTVPLAFLVGPNGRVVAVERSRWDRFQEIVSASGLQGRVRSLAGDARALPLRDDSVDLAVCVHGVRSLGDREDLVPIFREMLRAARRIFIAESLPVGRTAAQRAHLEMYDLRHEVFEAAYGRRDDLPYLPLGSLRALVEDAGGSIESAATVDVDLPHFLAYFPRSIVESIPDGEPRTRLLARWDEANSRSRQNGTDHPPVGVVVAARR